MKENKYYSIYPLLYMFYAVCKECGFSIENKEEGYYFCPQCRKKLKFLKLELYDGVKPSEIHEND